MAALKYIYTEEGLEEAIRIYSHNLTINETLLSTPEPTPEYKELLSNKKYSKMMRLGCMITLLIP